ncbi:bifunctional aspartate kinase/homoserine dehydrogenase I [Aquimarina sp. 2201CG5-10]|uniref:bifunctional aspartate kinase/homoserine dehydrogenase I n=1 Tax=Aquimarina callyspongiae TaxID=3098150 RepID=UPI002AB51C9A|nr:bifunctional aspartate kinase/homoserine dehydrogenase I [Aquimarina sp. 2201CG5-10]MDY8135809.1 bifunctional aspartate kinase/homoserine dehydrogenase I [Aquimarina sp. 2201CG5-10]
MNVLKFGGSSVANTTTIESVIKIIKKQSKKDTLYIVVSALGGVTDLLLQAGEEASSNNENYKNTLSEIERRHLETVKKLIPVVSQSAIISKVKAELNTLESLCEGVFLLSELSPKTAAVIASFGEMLSSYIIAEAAKERGLDLVLKDSRDFIITTPNSKVSIDYKETNDRIKKFADTNTNKVALFPGFVASTQGGEPTTLGRGGSDFTAAILAAALDVSELQIWTDVSGMYTANPKLVKQAKPVPHISYQEAMELSHFGAKVIYPPTIHPVLEKNIPIVIKNTFEPEDVGTLITREVDNRQKAVTGISHIDNISIISLEGSGMVGIPGFSKRLFEALFLENINVILITQASSEHSICLAVEASEAERAKNILDATFEYEIAKHKVDPVKIETEVAIVALVGDNMYHHQGLSGKMFSTLGKNNVNIRAIAQGASEKNISVVIEKKDIKKALNTLHERFFEVKTKQLNLFITGVGNVGGKLLSQLEQQKKYLKEKLRLKIRVVAVSNSKKMVFDENGISLDSWKESLENGQKADALDFFNKAKEMNLRNSIFVDNTANPQIAKIYKHYLAESMAVVTCNKIACADEYVNYEELQDLSRKFNASFLYETNVGAGLPIIDTLNNLIASGDNVHKIQAVLSGSLNFVFNNYKEGFTFHDIVKQAQKEGYTEPDPKIDLSGVDVARKILILARESGNIMELDNIKKEAFLPEESLATKSVDDFFESLEKNEQHFKQILEEANKKDCRLKYVAQYENEKAKVGLQHIPSDHPFYNLEGSDNIVLFYTDRYPEQPLIVKGAGAGADVTASGIFADIIRIGKK